MLELEIFLASDGPRLTKNDIPEDVNESMCVYGGSVGAKIRLVRRRELLPFIRRVDVIKGSLEEISFLSGTNNILRTLQKVSPMGASRLADIKGIRMRSSILKSML